MASPLFFSLQIASLRYRFHIPDSILFTNNYESIEAEFESNAFDYELSDGESSFDLQNAEFSIEYPKTIELELINETLDLEEGC